MFILLNTESLAGVHTHTHTHTSSIIRNVAHIFSNPKIRRPNIIDVGVGLDRPDTYQIQ